MDPLSAALKISGSGMEAEATRLRVVSENIANSRTTGDTRSDGDRPRPGTTGVTGVVDGLPRDDEPTTWPFPRR